MARVVGTQSRQRVTRRGAREFTIVKFVKKRVETQTELRSNGRHCELARSDGQRIDM